MRISELAQELGVESKVVIEYLKEATGTEYKAANKIEGYHEEMARDHFPAAKKEVEFEPAARPKAILRRGSSAQSVGVECPECGTVVQGGGIVKCPTCSMTFCAKCKEQLQSGDQVCPHCGNKKEQPKPEPVHGVSIRISDLAKELGVDPKSVCVYIYSEGYGNFTPDTFINSYIADNVRDYFKANKGYHQESRPQKPYNPGDYTDIIVKPASTPAPKEKSLWKRIKEILRIEK